VIKAYYDKKAKRLDGQVTADDRGYDPAKTAPTATALQPVLKQHAPPEAVPARVRTDVNRH
jgi:hypothetical protein